MENNSLSKREKKLIEQELINKLNHSIDSFIVEYTDNKTEWGEKLTQYVNDLAAKYRKRIDRDKEDPFNSGYWGCYCRNSPSKIHGDVFDAIVNSFNRHLGVPGRGKDMPDGAAAIYETFWNNLTVKLMAKNPFEGYDNDRAKMVKEKIDNDFYDALSLLFDGLDNVKRAYRFEPDDYE